LHTVAELLARALVDDDGGDRGEGIAILAGDRGIGEREHEQRKGDGTDEPRAGARKDEQERERERNRDRGPYDVSGYEGGEGDTEIQPFNFLVSSPPPPSSRSLPQPLQQRRNVHLVGLVVAGERIHHDIDAGAKCEFALARLGRDERQHGLAVLAHRPGAGEIIRGDDDRGYAVAGARRTARRLVVVDGRQRFHPQLAGVEAAGEVLQQVERLRQHVI